ncbi:phosphotransferase family protein [Spongiimicrobium sp. 3-5]|uniref:phosphotransferase family protein n=1 Tax=Spongiimicrobium sp. 3-5 TaxID=3332596 RepID=UPI00397F56CF
MISEQIKSVRKGEELDGSKLKAFLLDQELIKSDGSELIVNQFTHGYSNLTYLLQIEDRSFVLRRPPFGAIKRGHDMGREYKVQKALATGFSKVPKMYAFTSDESIIGSSFYLMEQVKGIILTYGEAKRRNIPKTDYPIIADTWLNTFVALHQVDYKAIGLDDLGKPEGYVSRQVTNWSKQYIKAATDDVAVAGKVMEWMEENQPKKYQHSLIHNDYKYDNVVFKDDSWTEIVAVLDWEMATLGDPMMDLGTSLAYWTMTGDQDAVKQGIPSPTIFEGNPSRTELVEKYTLKSDNKVDHLVFYYAFGLFKIAVIAQQIYYRFKHGFTKDPRFAYLNKASELCCNLAWKSIQTQKID